MLDNTGPTVTISGVPGTSSAAFTATITFLEGVTGFAVEDIAVGNGAASNFTGSDGGTAFTARITLAADGEVTVDVAAGVATDAAGNDNTAATRVSSTYTAPDTTAPRVASIARQTPSSSPTNANSLTWRVTFSEDVQNVDTADFTVSGTTATLTAAAVPGLSLAYDVTATGGNLAGLDGTVTLSFAVGQNITDTTSNALANTAPTGANEASYVLDNTGPGVTISDVPGTSSAAFTATITFLEGVTGFAVEDIAVGNGAASNFTGSDGGTAFTARITPAADGEVTVDVAAGVATDAAGNDNTAATRVSSTYTPPVIDNTAPRVTSITISPMPPEASEKHWPRYSTRYFKEEFLDVPDRAVHGKGATLTFTLTFDTAVTVTLDPDTRARPELLLDVFGRECRAHYTGGSGTQELTFAWTVVKGDNDPDGLEVQRIALNGATIRDSQGRDTAPETFPAARHKAHRVRGGLHTMWLSVSGSAREGAPFTVRVERSGGFDEMAHALVQVTDSGMPDLAPEALPEGAPLERDGLRLMSFPFDAGSGQGAKQDANPRFSVRTVAPPGDGVADGARTLTLRLIATDVGDGGISHWYDTGDPVEVTVPVADTGLAKDAPTLGVRDAWTREPTPEEAARGAVFPLSFDMVLRPAGAEEMTVKYETRNGTAHAGADYVAKRGTLTFAPGETLKTLDVPVMADSHDEGSETMTLVLSNATGAVIADIEATGTIRNSGPIPKAWIARFGRTVAEQVLEAVDRRMRAGREPGVEIALVGERVGGEPPDRGPGQVEPGSDAEREARREEAARRHTQRQADWLKGETDPEEAHRRFRAVTSRDLLTGSAFALTAETAGKGVVSLWGRGAIGRFEGREGELTLDGEVMTGMFGADWSRGRWTAGLIVSHSRGEGGYSDGTGSGEASSTDSGSGSGAGTGGRVEATLTGLLPWARHAFSERLEAWGAAGYGAGELTVTPKKPGTDEDGAAIRADLDLRMAAAGLRGTMLDGGWWPDAHGQDRRDGRADRLRTRAGRRRRQSRTGPGNGDPASPRPGSEPAGRARQRGGADAEPGGRPAPRRRRRRDRLRPRPGRRARAERPEARPHRRVQRAVATHPRVEGVPRARLLGFARLGREAVLGPGREADAHPDGRRGVLGRRRCAPVARYAGRAGGERQRRRRQ